MDVPLRLTARRQCIASRQSPPSRRSPERARSRDVGCTHQSGVAVARYQIIKLSSAYPSLANAGLHARLIIGGGPQSIICVPPVSRAACKRESRRWHAPVCFSLAAAGSLRSAAVESPVRHGLLACADQAAHHFSRNEARAVRPLAGRAVNGEIQLRSAEVSDARAPGQAKSTRLEVRVLGGQCLQLLYSARRELGPRGQPVSSRAFRHKMSSSVWFAKMSETWVQCARE